MNPVKVEIKVNNTPLAVVVGFSFDGLTCVSIRRAGGLAIATWTAQDSVDRYGPRGSQGHGHGLNLMAAIGWILVSAAGLVYNWNEEGDDFDLHMALTEMASYAAAEEVMEIAYAG